jgi:spermidine/putrescine transport system substrate-binding protein
MNLKSYAPNNKLIDRLAGPATAVCAGLGLIWLAACAPSTPPPTPTPPALAKELVFYDWAEDSIADVFEIFSQEYGVKIKYVTFESTEEAVANLRAGQVYDVVVIENQFIPALAKEGLLAKIDYRNLPNFKNILANFRDLAYDPQNKYSIPYSWGTTGLVVRTDLAAQPITRWADMWQPQYAGRIVNWASAPRYTLGLALRSLGYSVNSENPAELEAALRRLLELKPNSIWLDREHTIAPWLVSGQAVIGVGWSEDVWLAQAENEAITYVLPQEGAILWGDNFVIPANSPHKYTAELFLNFILRPEISGQIVNSTYYPMPNQAATAFIEPEILQDSTVYPTNEELQNAEILLPLTPQGEQLHAQIWERFLAAGE